jgi:ribosomal protein S20
MSDLVKREKHFLKLFLSTSNAQRRALINSITSSQLKAVVQIVYNALQGNLTVNDRVIRALKESRLVIRRFVSKDLTHQQRKRLLSKYTKQFLLLLKPVVNEAWLKN